MKNLSKSILNYYATFTETRFNFRTLINYQWSDDELTLDFGIFHNFQKQILKHINLGKKKDFSIKKGDFQICLPDKLISKTIVKELNNKFSIEYLKTCIKFKEKKFTKNRTLIASNKAGDIKPKELNYPEIKEFKKHTLIEGCRDFNIALRKEFENILITLHDQEVEKLKEIHNFSQSPPSSFNSYDISQEVFDDLQNLANKSTSQGVYFKKVVRYLTEKKWSIVLYDLFYILNKFSGFANLGTLYIFIHQMRTKTQIENAESKKYPLYFYEINLTTNDNEVMIHCPRDLIMINTPAVNYCQFDSVLTIPRASLFSDATKHLKTMETFLQTHYKRNTPFILESDFRKIVNKNENFPDISFKIGFQVIKQEDKKLLDYSELLVMHDKGEEKKFANLIDGYINENVYNTSDQVRKDFNQEYPQKTPKRYISESPIPLNLQQKRIITATANNKNKIIVIDGPPGTGKSHTIAALTYWANQNKKSLVVTSHKEQALDVIDQMLTDKFKDLHPKTKPSILRFAKNNENLLNSPQNTLSGPAINGAVNRVDLFNKLAVKNDKEESIKNLNKLLVNKIQVNQKYKALSQKLIEYEKLKLEIIDQKILNIEDVDSIKKTTNSINANFSIVESEKLLKFFVKLTKINTQQLDKIISSKSLFKRIKNACDRLSKLSLNFDKETFVSKSIPEDFKQLVQELSYLVKPNVDLKNLQKLDKSILLSKNIFQKIKQELNKNEEKLKLVETNINKLSSLKYDTILSDIASINKVNKYDLTINKIKEGVNKLDQYIKAKKDLKSIQDFKQKIKLEFNSYKELYQFIDILSDSSDLITSEVIEMLFILDKQYSKLLEKIDINTQDLSSFSKLSNLSESNQKIWDLIKLHFQLTNLTQIQPEVNINQDKIHRVEQKLIENQNDERLKLLHNFTGDISRALSSINAGKRISSKEAKIILENISCIIANPEMISRYFPMQEDIIDLLIIDEASQVSIAESISLILRAKQVVIFGDELQYGAIGAFNVNSKYAQSYFKNIIDHYGKDYDDTVSEKTQQSILKEVGKTIKEDNRDVEEVLSPKKEANQIWLKTFDIRTSTLDFCKAIANYKDSLTTHFRSFNEIIDYSNEFFYKESQMPLIVNRIRTKPIKEVLRFIKVKTKGHSGNNVNLDEIETIKQDIEKLLETDYKGTIGIITSFREQASKTEEILRRELKNYPKLEKKHKLTVWFVGDVQGEERDIVYYSFVQDEKLDNAQLYYIYPVIGGQADNIRNLRMQRLNVGFSRAKDTMVFVHSMPISSYSKTRLGEALKHYQQLLETTKDDILVDISKLESPAEIDLYQLLIQTDFFKKNQNQLKIIPQFKIGDYIKQEFHRNIPKYRVDFLVTLSMGGKERALILEYDGVEYHTNNPDIITAANITQEYLDYDINRQIELESYGYKFLRINKFTLLPEENQTKLDVLDSLLENSFK
jgi:superfamily I DNA and/or RNA helicase